MSKLPGTWAKVAIGDLCELTNGRAFKPTDWTSAGLPIVRIQNLNDSGASFNYYNGKVRDQFLIDRGDLLFAWSGTPGTSFGAHVWTGGKAVLNQHIFNVRYDSTAVDRDFFRLAINQKLGDLIGKAHGGVGLRHVTKGKFEETEVELPPLSEQRRIVAKLGNLFARAKAARDELARIPLLIEHYKQAILEKAFAGDLTSGWRSIHSRTCLSNAHLASKTSCYGEELPSVPKDWKLLKLCDLLIPGRDAITTGPFGSLLSKKDYTFSGVPIVGVENVKPDGFVYKTSKYISAEKAEKLAKYLAKSGDVLITRSGTVGDVSVYPGDLENAVISTNLMRLRIDDTKINPTLFCYIIRGSAIVLRQLERLCSGSTRIFLNQKILNELLFPVPPLKEQKEILLRLDNAWEWLNVVTTEQERAAHLLDHLDKGLLAKAFRGELVPQDPNDEPAEKLLERILAMRTAQPKPRRGRLLQSREVAGA